MPPTATAPEVMSNGLPLTSTLQSDHTDRQHEEEKSVKWTILQILSGIFIICLIPYLHIGEDVKVCCCRIGVYLLSLSCSNCETSVLSCSTQNIIGIKI